MKKDSLKKILGLLLAVLTYFLMKGNVDEVIARTAAVTVLMAAWWVMVSMRAPVSPMPNLEP